MRTVNLKGNCWNSRRPSCSFNLLGLIYCLIKQKIPQYEINWTFGSDWKACWLVFCWETERSGFLSFVPTGRLCLFFGRRLCVCFLARLFFPLCSAINRPSHDRHVWFMWGCWMGTRRLKRFPLSVQAARPMCLLHCIKNAAGRTEAAIYLVMTHF